MANASVLIRMGNQFDIAGYSADGKLVLLAEVKAMKGVAPAEAAVFRRNLLAHGLLPADIYFLLAYRTAIYLWEPGKGPADAPTFEAEAKPIFSRFLGQKAGQNEGFGGESAEFAIKNWLTEFAFDVGDSDPETEADKLVRNSGLAAKLRGGEVRRDFVA